MYFFIFVHPFVENRIYVYHCGYSYEEDGRSFRSGRSYTSVTLHGVTHQNTPSLTRGIRFGTAFLVHMLKDKDDDDDYYYDDDNYDDYDDDNNNNNNKEAKCSSSDPDSNIIYGSNSKVTITKSKKT